jgi:hypothetical protein
MFILDFCVIVKISKLISNAKDDQLDKNKILACLIFSNNQFARFEINMLD